MKIILSIVLSLFVLGCSSDEKKEETTTTAVKEVVKAEEVKVAPVEAPKTQEITVTVPTAEGIKDKVAEVQKSVSEMKMPTTEEVEKSVTEATQTVKAKTTEVVEEVTQAVNVAMVDEKGAFASCTGCHGSNGEKKALGRSEIIKGWDAQRTIDALNGYKDGSYGGSMKGMMKGQVTKLSDAQIKAIANYVSGL